MHVNFETSLDMQTEMSTKTNQSSGGKLEAEAETLCLAAVHSIGVKSIVLEVCNVRKGGGPAVGC